ncbi:ER membrane protein complex subunit 10-like [Dendronephthya gigantea]|uniref:ER membrane protein complex subunit 10-like n=1 Tax=Dendronephthya gigantea TaxID=151771 RepID=UPI00106BB141|nr:ER membrane protein complex subunit 10-like [Dendronephthya gigantea]
MDGNSALVVLARNFLCFLVFVGSFVSCKTSDVGREGLTLVVEHAVGTGPKLNFQERGEIIIKSLKGISGSYNDYNILSSEEFKNSIKDASYQGNFYHIRIAVEPLETEESGNKLYISTFIKACSLLKSNFSDIIKLNVDHTGQIFAVSLSTTTADCSGINDEEVQ